jgi:hypothetical protein
MRLQDPAVQEDFADGGGVGLQAGAKYHKHIDRGGNLLGAVHLGDFLPLKSSAQIHSSQSA